MDESTWPEQNAVDAWIKKYRIDVTHAVSMELKKAVTAYRIEVQEAARASDAAAGEPVSAGMAEADRVINRLMSSDPDFDDCTGAANLIRRLIAEQQSLSRELLAALELHPSSEPKALTDERELRMFEQWYSGPPTLDSSRKSLVSKADALEVWNMRAAVAQEYDELIRHMDAGGNFHEFMAARALLRESDEA